jgi:hypothetical protein
MKSIIRLNIPATPPPDVVMSWLRLQTRTDCFPHPCHIYTQCFSTLICRGWAYGCTLTLLHLCKAGVDFRKIELSPSPSDVVMSWLRLQTRTDCFPHPWHMYTKCFSTLIRCGWAYGGTLTQFYPPYLAHILGFGFTCGVNMM